MILNSSSRCLRTVHSIVNSDSKRDTIYYFLVPVVE